MHFSELEHFNHFLKTKPNPPAEMETRKLFDGQRTLCNGPGKGESVTNKPTDCLTGVVARDACECASKK